MSGKKQAVKIVKVTLERHIPLERNNCLRCGKSFLGSKLKKYCSRSCVRKASYWRNPDGYRQSRKKSYKKKKERTVQE